MVWIFWSNWIIKVLFFALLNNFSRMPNNFWIWRHFFHRSICPKLVLVYIWFRLIYTPIDGAGSPYPKQYRSILKTISKSKDQISLRWQLTRVHSKFVGHSTEIIRQSRIKGPLLTTAWDRIYGGNETLKCGFKMENTATVLHYQTPTR